MTEEEERKMTEYVGEPTFMSETYDEGCFVAIQNPFIAQLVSGHDYGPKPKFKPGQYVKGGKIKPFGGKMGRKVLKGQILARQCCTHYVRFPRNLTEDPAVIINHNSFEFWYLIQNPNDPLRIDWIKEEDIVGLQEVESSPPHHESRAGGAAGPIDMDTNPNPYSVSI